MAESAALRRFFFENTQIRIFPRVQLAEVNV
jgi:hypothetical protein